MAKEKKEPSLPATNTAIVPKSLVPEITGAVATLLGPPVVELTQSLGVSIEDTVRFLVVTRECIRSILLAAIQYARRPNSETEAACTDSVLRMV
jgi:hypothetical protein